VNIFDLSANMQAAADMARFRHSQVPNVLSLESPLYDRVGAQLAAMGHTVKPIDGANVGGFQSILFTPAPDTATSDPNTVNGYYRAGSDFRKDGQAVGW
jgi:gamma-glutamyltranspeptidase / glutathione hydrolase